MSRLRFLPVLAALTLQATVVVVAVAPAPAEALATIVYNGAGSAPRIGIIGDSAFAGIQVANTFGPLQRFNFVFDAEVCRRTVAPSCRAGGSTPETALAVLRQRSGQWGSVLVMTTGYNDGGTIFDDAVDTIMAEAARQGIRKVMWVTFRTAPVTFVPPTYQSTSSTFRDNNSILLQKAEQYGGRLQIADWATYSSGRGDWFASDGIHFQGSGATAAAQYIASQAARVLSGQSITPTRTGQPAPSTSGSWTFLRFGMGGTAVAQAQRALIARGIPLPTGVDGVFGVRTKYAVATFQRLRGLHDNGIIDDLTARALGLYSGDWRNVRLGMTGWRVKAIQVALINRGIFVRYGATGRFTLPTYYAVRTFQRLQGLPVTGVVDGVTARALGRRIVPESSAIWTALSRGSTGINVARVQRALMDRGIAVRGGPTGRFDVYTLYAVNTFQRLVGLPVSGVVDVETAQALGLFRLSNPVATFTSLRVGSTGATVSRAERALMAAGVRVRDGVDGVFKLGDYYAVRTFQRLTGLPVTGVVDMRTASRLGLFGGTVATVARATTEPELAISAASSPPPPSTADTTTTSTSTSSTTTTVPAATTTSTTVAPSTTAPSAGATTPVSGVVWIDADVNGIRDATESLVPNFAVRLLDAGGSVIGSAVTDEVGAFEFTGLPAGSYRLEVDVPDGHVVAPADQIPAGFDPEAADDVDSDFSIVDAVAGTARTEPIEVTAEAVDDLGLGFVPVPSDTTTSPSTSAASTTVEATSTVATTIVETTTTVPASTTTTITVPPTAVAPSTTASTTTTSAP